MKFAAMIEYTKDSAKITEIRPAHRKYLAQLKEAGQLAVCGPFTDDGGGLIVYEANTKEEAEALIRNDPFCQNQVFVSWLIRPWNVVMANRDLFPT